MAKKLQMVNQDGSPDLRQFNRHPVSPQIRQAMSLFFRDPIGRARKEIQRAEIERLLAMRKARLSNG
jgi:hypothetical protein